jgi:hypothetical protein
VMYHLGNIATRTGKLVRWDPKKEEIISDPQANQWTHYEYRKPWKLEQDRSESL